MLAKNGNDIILCCLRSLCVINIGSQMNFHCVLCIKERAAWFTCTTRSLWRGDLKHTMSFIIQSMENHFEIIFIIWTKTKRAYNYLKYTFFACWELVCLVHHYFCGEGSAVKAFSSCVGDRGFEPQSSHFFCRFYHFWFQIMNRYNVSFKNNLIFFFNYCFKF